MKSNRPLHSKDPAARPASALEVAAALPVRSDAAALAAGETPSLRWLRRAQAGHLRPAWLLLVGVFLILLPFAAGLPRHVRLSRDFPGPPPEALRAHSRDVIRKLGYTEQRSTVLMASS